MKIFLFLILPVFFALSISAQDEKTCELPITRAPALFNLKLGMSGSQAKRAAGGQLNIKNKKEGTFFQNFIKDAPPRALSGVRAVYLRFFASKLYQIEVFYENENAVLEEFVRTFSRRENLPLDAWKIEYGIARLDCDGFFIEIDNYLNPRVELTDQALLAEFEKSQDEK